MRTETATATSLGLHSSPSANPNALLLPPLIEQEVEEEQGNEVSQCIQDVVGRTLADCNKNEENRMRKSSSQCLASIVVSSSNESGRSSEMSDEPGVTHHHVQDDNCDGLARRDATNFSGKQCDQIVVHKGSDSPSAVTCGKIKSPSGEKSLETPSIIESEKKIFTDELLTSHTPLLSPNEDNNVKTNKELCNTVPKKDPPHLPSHNQLPLNNSPGKTVLMVQIKQIASSIALAISSPVEIFESDLKIFCSLEVIDLKSLEKTKPNRGKDNSTCNAVSIDDNKEAEQAAINQMAHNLTKCTILTAAEPVQTLTISDIFLESHNQLPPANVDLTKCIFLVVRLSRRTRSTSHYIANNITPQIHQVIEDSFRLSNKETVDSILSQKSFYLSLNLPPTSPLNSSKVASKIKKPSSKLKNTNSNSENREIMPSGRDRPKVYKAKFKLLKNENLLTFGLKICGSGPTVISNIIHNSRADKMSKFHPGDVFLSINSKSVKFSSHSIIKSIIKESQPNLVIVLQHTSSVHDRLKIWHMTPTKLQPDTNLPHANRISRNLVPEKLQLDSPEKSGFKNFRSFNCNLNRVADLQNIFGSSPKFLHDSSFGLNLSSDENKISKINHNSDIKSDEIEYTTGIVKDILRDIYNISAILNESSHIFSQFIDEITKKFPEEILNQINPRINCIMYSLEDLNNSVLHIISSRLYDETFCIICKLEAIFFGDLAKFFDSIIRYTRHLLSFFKALSRHQHELRDADQSPIIDDNFILRSLIPSETYTKLVKYLIRISYNSNHPRFKYTCQSTKSHLSFNKQIGILNENFKVLKHMKIDQQCIVQLVNNNNMDNSNWFDNENCSTVIFNRLIWGTHVVQKQKFESQTLEYTNFALLLDTSSLSTSRSFLSLESIDECQRVTVFLVCTTSILLITVRVKKTLRLSVTQAIDFGDIIGLSYIDYKNSKFLILQLADASAIHLEFKKKAVFKKYFDLLSQCCRNIAPGDFDAN
ncbi:MAG: hypothetical protein MHMPM18_001607 [Marteilia pararefringens]